MRGGPDPLRELPWKRARPARVFHDSPPGNAHPRAPLLGLGYWKPTLHMPDCRHLLPVSISAVRDWWDSSLGKARVPPAFLWFVLGETCCRCAGLLTSTPRKCARRSRVFHDSCLGNARGPRAFLSFTTRPLLSRNVPFHLAMVYPLYLWCIYCIVALSCGVGDCGLTQYLEIAGRDAQE